MSTGGNPGIEWKVRDDMARYCCDSAACAAKPRGAREHSDGANLTARLSSRRGIGIAHQASPDNGEQLLTKGSTL
jgi:hypothetical protein